MISEPESELTFALIALPTLPLFGRTGYQPVSPVNRPDGTGEASMNHPGAGFVGTPIPFRSAGCRAGRAGSPHYPFFGHVPRVHWQGWELDAVLGRGLHDKIRRVFCAASLLISVLVFSGCSSVAPYQQRLVSKPNMSFTGAGAFTYQSKMLAQIEPGSMFSGGVRAVGCAACGQ